MFGDPLRSAVNKSPLLSSTSTLALNRTTSQPDTITNSLSLYYHCGGKGQGFAQEDV